MGFLQRLTNEKLFGIILILAGIWLVIDNIDKVLNVTFNFLTVTNGISTTKAIQTVADPFILAGIGVILILLGLK